MRSCSFSNAWRVRSIDFTRIASSEARRSSESTTITRMPVIPEGTSCARVRGGSVFSRAVIPTGQLIHLASSTAASHLSSFLFRRRFRPTR